MAFDAPLPSAEDWLRDPVFSWGRMIQVLNYRLDQWNVMGKDIPKMQAQIEGYDAALKRLPANAARQAVADQLFRAKAAVDEFVAKRSSLSGKVFEAISSVRNEAARIAQPAQVMGVGAAFVVTPVVIAIVGLVVFGITQLVRDWVAIKAQNDSLGVRILEYGKSTGLTPTQIGQLSSDLSKLPKPEGPGLFGDLEAILPAVLGIAALVIFGPTLARMVGSGRRAA